MRTAQGAPVARMAAILGVVIAVTLASALLFQTKAMKRLYRLERGDRAAGVRPPG
jgi:hypothetical protein